MNKLVSSIIALLLILLMAYGVYDFYLNYEYKEKVIHTGFKGEARKNNFYASRLFLKRMGIPTETKNSLQGLGGLPDTDTVLIITTRRTTLSPQKTNELINWVKSGGHLIALATRDWKYSGSEKDTPESNREDIDSNGMASPDPLQRFMGVRTTARVFRIDDDENETNNIPSLKLKGTDKPLKLKASRYPFILVDKQHKKQTEEIKLHTGNYIIRQKVGNGLITLIADMRFINNDKIELEDHAELLWQLVHGLHKTQQQPTQVWLIHNDKMPPLWKLLWDNFWAFILSLTLLLLLWLLKVSQRFGPLIPKQEENRRSLNEHITSSGNFYWKNNKKQALINSSRKALIKRLSQVHPGWDQRTKEEQITLLAEQLTVKPESIQRLLYAQNIEQADEFTQLIRELETIRKNI